MTDLTLLPCPCCGSQELTEEGGFEICSVCNWEDDNAQRNDPDLRGGANSMSLNEAIKAFGKGQKVQ